MTMPSKELLSAVLGETYIGCNESKTNSILNLWKLGCRAPDDCEEYSVEINIYELEHLMIIWAAHQNFKVKHELTYGVERGRAKLLHTQNMGTCVFGYVRQHTYESGWFEATSKPEAVTKACEWIRENS